MRAKSIVICVEIRLWGRFMNELSAPLFAFFNRLYQTAPSAFLCLSQFRVLSSTALSETKALLTDTSFLITRRSFDSTLTFPAFVSSFVLAQLMAS